MSRKKTSPTDRLSEDEKAVLKLIHSGKSQADAVNEIWPGRYKQPAAKGSKLKNDPRGKTYLATLQEVDAMRVRAIF